MGETELLISQKKVSGRFAYEIKVRRVPLSSVYPDGYKINCALWLVEEERKVLILDSHAPFSAHLHPDPENDHERRISIKLTDPVEIVDFFAGLVSKILMSDDYENVIREVEREINKN